MKTASIKVEKTGMAGFTNLVAHGVSVFLLVVIAVAASGFRNIEDALAFYGVYHRDPMNQLIHFFGVPLIIWSLFIFWTHLPIPVLSRYYQLPNLPKMNSHPINYATIAAVGYALFYIKIDPFGGSLYIPVIYIMYASALNMTAKDQAEAASKASKKDITTITWTGTGKVLQIALILHALAWYVQIHPGHAVLEGAKPAITDSFGGALTSAPLFAFYEGLWYLGINRALQVKTHALIAQYTAQLCAAGSTMRVCASL